MAETITAPMAPKTPLKKSLIPVGAKPRVTPKEGEVPPGTPITQTLPLFIGGMLVAAEIHDLPNPDELDKPINGYKMWSSQTGYVWVPKAQGDSMYAAADEADPTIIAQAIAQGLRIGVPAPPPPDPPITR